MRLTRLAHLVAALGLTFFAAQCLAQDAVYVRYTNSWRYYQSGDQGTAWRAAGFVDSAWPQGLGLFYAETTLYPQPFNTPMTPPNAGGPITTYYRTHFTYSGSTSGVRFTVTNHVDDGMVAYLNGTEVFRYNMPAGAITFATQAPVANPPGEPVTFITNFLATSLINGDNVLAVEVHQAGTGSSDVVMGLSMGTVGRPVITAEPQSQTNVAGSQTILCVAATGSAPTYQWQRDNGAGGWVNLAGAIFPCYTNGTTPLSAAGMYRAIVSNAAGSATSQVATLTVVVDNIGPIVLNATVSELQSTNQITVTFNEKLIGSSVNISAATSNHFVVYARAGGATNRVTVENVFYNSGSANSPESFAVLRVGGPNWNTSANAYNGTINYYIIVNNVRDLLGNVIAPNSTIGVSFPNNIITNVMDWNAQWLYHVDWGNPFNGDPTIYQQPWHTLEYKPETNGHWGGVGGIVYKDTLIQPGTYVPCAGTLGTEGTYVITPTLFRSTFVWPTNYVTNNVTLRLRTVVDDGAIIYLNGTEILRQNVGGTGLPNEFTRSTGEYADGTCLSNQIVNVNLRHGTNLLAAAVCQFTTPGANGGDLYWAARLDVVQTSLTTGAVPRSSTNANALRILASKVGANQVRLSWWTNVEPTHSNNLYNYTVVYGTNALWVGPAPPAYPNGKHNVTDYQLQPGITNGMVTNFVPSRLPYYFRLQRVP